MFDRSALLGVLAILLIALAAYGDLVADSSPVDSPPRTDGRLERAKTLNDEHTFTPPSTLSDWSGRAQRVRQQILVAAGLWPMPERIPVEPVIHGKIDRDTYTVEKVFFESYSGFYVTGNLYRPKGRTKGKRPAVLSPHGHWRNGRFSERDEAAARAQIALGKEGTMSAARYHLQARCAMLARMGCIVFFYDMVGYADSKQIEHRAGFKDAEAELRLQSAFGLQVYNSIRALDFLAELPDVDPERIGVTGASGGGTQTFFLGAVDERPRALFPAVMVSTGMQGGCICENATLLRVNTSNVEFAALAAPKPVAMTGADDWTIDIESKGLPDLKKLYALFNAEEHIYAKSFPEFEHNYNQVSREIMYTWFNRHLDLGWPEATVKELPFEPLSPKDLSVFDATHPLPENAVDAAGLRQTLTRLSNEQVGNLTPKGASELPGYREILLGALGAIVNSEVPTPDTVRHTLTGAREVDGYRVEWLDLSRDGTRDRVPALWVVPERWSGKVVVAVSDNGMGAFATSAGSGRSQGLAVAALVDGAAVLAPDVLLAVRPDDESTTPSLAVDEQRHKQYVGYTFGYNRTLLASRVHDVLTAVGYARAQSGTKSIDLVGTGEGGLWVMFAKAIARDAGGGVVADAPNFDFGDIEDVNDPRLLPGGLKYGGWGAFAALCAPAPLTLVGENELPAILQSVYAAANSSDRLRRSAQWSGELVGQLLE